MWCINMLYFFYMVIVVLFALWRYISYGCSCYAPQYFPNVGIFFTFLPSVQILADWNISQLLDGLPTFCTDTNVSWRLILITLVITWHFFSSAAMRLTLLFTWCIITFINTNHHIFSANLWACNLQVSVHMCMSFNNLLMSFPVCGLCCFRYHSFCCHICSHICISQPVYFQWVSHSGAYPAYPLFCSS